MYKKRIDRRYFIVLIIVVLSFSLVVLSISLKKGRNLNPVEKIFKDAGTLVIKLSSYPFTLIRDTVKAKEEESIDVVKASNKNLESEVKKLKELLDLNTLLSDKVLVNATVIHRNIGYFEGEVTIDKGSSSGITKDMAVVTTKGLIGKTSKVSNYTSTIKLLSNENMDNKLSVKVKTDDDYVYGLIYKYNFKTNTYYVEGISQNVEIPENADVVTTGMGNVFPSGLLIGKVKGVVADNFDLSKVLEVSSSVDFNDIDYVTVVKREK